MITQSTNNTPNAFNLLLQSFGVMFSNSEYERQFKQIYVVSSVITTQTFLAIGGISFLMYYEQDILIDPKNHYIPNMIRLIYSTPLILLCSFSLFFNKIKQYVEIVVIINAVVIISAQVWIFSELKNGYSYAAVGFSIIFLALSVAFVVRIGYLLLISVMTLTGTIGGHIYANNSDEGWLIVNTIGILTALLLGIVAAVIRERTVFSDPQPSSRTIGVHLFPQQPARNMR